MVLSLSSHALVMMYETAASSGGFVLSQAMGSEMCRAPLSTLQKYQVRPVVITP